MHRQVCLLAEDGMSPALTKNEYGVMIGQKKQKRKQKKNPAKGRTGREHAKRVLNESEPQEARICKGWR